ncbi:MAG: TRAP transporter substrate-binding protein DctP, partial [Pseudolabrys sp.]|nr:TRAP transporter substrate-binding protein DctP [Pseudolabrys sp.]
NLTITEPSAVHTKAPITDLDQLKGVRVRAPTPSVTAMLNAIGATPVGMPPGQIYESAERGVIDGNVMPWGPVGAFKLYEVFKNHLNARIDAVAMYTLMNEARYKSLPPDIRKLFDDSRKHFVDVWSTLWKETDDKAIETAKAAGNKVVDLPDAKRIEWREKMKPVVDEYIAEQAKTVANSREIYDAMVVALKKYE